MIEAHQLTKCDGDTTAVEDLSVTVRPGIVTGFLGPNGAGRPTAMRTILGLDANVVHTGRSADHLRVMAATTGIGRGRVGGSSNFVGLREEAPIGTVIPPR